MSRSAISTDDSIPGIYPGADMRVDLFDALGVSVAEVATATGLSSGAIDGFLDGSQRIDADFDRRMGRYFGFSAGYLLRLQISYDLMGTKRRSGEAIAAIPERSKQVA